jgi:hypothetical protein
MSNSLSPRELTVEAEPSPDDIRYLEDSIYAFNVRATGIADGKLFGIFLRGGRACSLQCGCDRDLWSARSIRGEASNDDSSNCRGDYRGRRCFGHCYERSASE